MRLTELLNRLQQAKTKFQYSHSGIQLNGTAFTQINGLSNVQRVMRILQPTNLFDDVISRFKKSPAGDVYADSIKMILEKEAQKLANEHIPGASPETIQRLSHSIDLMGEQLMRGAEVYPSLVSSESAKASFPDMTKFITSMGEMKKIENNGVQDSNQEESKS